MVVLECMLLICRVHKVIILSFFPGTTVILGHLAHRFSIRGQSPYEVWISLCATQKKDEQYVNGVRSFTATDAKPQ